MPSWAKIEENPGSYVSLGGKLEDAAAAMGAPSSAAAASSSSAASCRSADVASKLSGKPGPRTGKPFSQVWNATEIAAVLEYIETKGNHKQYKRNTECSKTKVPYSNETVWLTDIFSEFGDKVDPQETALIWRSGFADLKKLVDQNQIPRPRRNKKKRGVDGIKWLRDTKWNGVQEVHQLDQLRALIHWFVVRKEKYLPGETKEEAERRRNSVATLTWIEKPEPEKPEKSPSAIGISGDSSIAPIKNGPSGGGVASPVVGGGGISASDAAFGGSSGVGGDLLSPPDSGPKKNSVFWKEDSSSKEKDVVDDVLLGSAGDKRTVRNQDTTAGSSEDEIGRTGDDAKKKLPQDDEGEEFDDPGDRSFDKDWSDKRVDKVYGFIKQQNVMNNNRDVLHVANTEPDTRKLNPTKQGRPPQVVSLSDVMKEFGPVVEKKVEQLWSGEGAGVTELAELVKRGRIPGPERRAAKGFAAAIWRRSKKTEKGQSEVKSLEQLRCMVYWFGVMNKKSLPGETEKEAQIRRRQQKKIDWSVLWPEGKASGYGRNRKTKAIVHEGEGGLDQNKKRKLNEGAPAAGSAPSLPHMPKREYASFRKQKFEVFEKNKLKFEAAKKLASEKYAALEQAIQSEQKKPLPERRSFQFDFHADPKTAICVPVWEVEKGSPKCEWREKHYLYEFQSDPNFWPQPSDFIKKSWSFSKYGANMIGAGTFGRVYVARRYFLESKKATSGSGGELVVVKASARCKESDNNKDLHQKFVEDAKFLRGFYQDALVERETVPQDESPHRYDTDHLLLMLGHGDGFMFQGHHCEPFDLCSCSTDIACKEYFRQTESPVGLVTATFWMFQALQGQRYLGKKKLIHTDIKPANIFLKFNERAISRLVPRRWKEEELPRRGRLLSEVQFKAALATATVKLGDFGELMAEKSDLEFEEVPRLDEMGEPVLEKGLPVGVHFLVEVFARCSYVFFFLGISDRTFMTRGKSRLCSSLCAPPNACLNVTSDSDVTFKDAVGGAAHKRIGLRSFVTLHFLSL